jgi:nucleoside-diphosphate-sugar epimerase
MIKELFAMASMHRASSSSAFSGDERHAVKPRLLLLACGSLGSALGEQMTQLGWSVTGIRRNPPHNISLNGFRWLQDDLTSSSWRRELLAHEYVVYTPSPAGRAVDAYELLYRTALVSMLKTLASDNVLKLWLQVSSTSVYGQVEGEWVDELSVAQPHSPSAQLIRQAESRLQDKLDVRACVLRFSGIYGGDRQYLLRRVAQGKALRTQHFTNRIHQADCVGLMAAILNAHAVGDAVAPLYVGTDKTPVTEWHIGAWLANQLGVPTPRQEKGPLSGKRCVSRFVDDLPYAFKYPSYESGYGAQIDELRTQSSDWLAPLR